MKELKEEWNINCQIGMYSDYSGTIPLALLENIREKTADWWMAKFQSKVNAYIHTLGEKRCCDDGYNQAVSDMQELARNILL